MCEAGIPEYEKVREAKRGESIDTWVLKGDIFGWLKSGKLHLAREENRMKTKAKI